jgi:hypothetical protein
MTLHKVPAIDSFFSQNIKYISKQNGFIYSFNRLTDTKEPIKRYWKTDRCNVLFCLFLILHRRYCHVLGCDVQCVPLVVTKAQTVQECLFQRTGCISGERKSNYSCATIKSEWDCINNCTHSNCVWVWFVQTYYFMIGPLCATLLATVAQALSTMH